MTIDQGLVYAFAAGFILGGWNTAAQLGIASTIFDGIADHVAQLRAFLGRFTKKAGPKAKKSTKASSAKK